MRHYFVFLFFIVSVAPATQANQCIDITADEELRPYEQRVKEVSAELLELERSLLSRTLRQSSYAEQAKQRESESDYHKRRVQQRRLQFVAKKLKALKDLIRESRDYFNMTIDEESLLLARLEGPNSHLWMYALDMIHAMRSHSGSDHEKNFWTSSFYYLVYGPDSHLFTVPFHHWMLSVVFDARKLEKHLWPEFFHSRESHLTRLSGYYQFHPNMEDRAEMSTPSYDDVLRMIAAIQGRNMVAEYSEAVQTGVLRPWEVTMLTYAVPDLRPQEIQRTNGFMMDRDPYLQY